MKEEFSFGNFKPVVTFGRNRNGAYIQGYLNQNRDSIYAIKSVSVALPNADSLLHRLHQEYSCLKHIYSTEDDKGVGPSMQLYSSYIVDCYGLYENPLMSELPVKPLYLCLEAIMGGNLSQYYHHLETDLDYFDFRRIRVYATQLVNVLLFLFWKGVIHRDIKLSNIVLNSFGHIKLIDFDLAKIVDDDTNNSGRARTICGTLHLLAPEVIAYGGHSTEWSEEGYDFAVDWWSLGHFVYEMMMKTRSIPFQWHDGFTDAINDRILANDCIPASVRATARHVIEQSRRGETSFQSFNEHWNFRSVSELRNLTERYQKTGSSTSTTDFSSYIPIHACFQEEILSLLIIAEDFISLLLTVAPERRFGIGSMNSSLTRMEGNTRREKVDNLFRDQTLQQSLFHPFLVSEILFPNDLDGKDTREQYIHFLRREYRFPINEKISYYEMFPNFNEAKALEIEKGNKSDHNARNQDSDELTDEQQALFRDF